MPEVRLLANWTNQDGEIFAAGQVIPVGDDEARDLTARGHASLIEEEKKLEQQTATNAVYDARLQQPVGGTARAEPEPEPEPEPKASKKK